jgi:prefoldin subunit 5
MKRIFLIPCIFFALLTIANAEELYKCIDSKGNTVITSTPQDGMNCFSGESDEQPKSKNISSKRNISSKTNLSDICGDFSNELDEINAEINTLEKHRSALQREQLEKKQSESEREQLDVRKNDVQYSRYGVRGRSTPVIPVDPINDEINKLNKKISILYQKQSLVNQDIRLYKCNELKNDLSKLNQKKYEINNRRYKNQ